MPKHKQKPSSLVILQVKLTYYLASLWVITEEMTSSIFWFYGFSFIPQRTHIVVKIILPLLSFAFWTEKQKDERNSKIHTTHSPVLVSKKRGPSTGTYGMLQLILENQFSQFSKSTHYSRIRI